MLPARVVYNDLKQAAIDHDCEWSTVARTLDSGLQVSRVVLPGYDVYVPVRVLNPKEQTVELKAGEFIANLEPVEVCAARGETEPDVDISYDEILQDMVNRIDAYVEDPDRQRLHDLLKQF